MGAGGLWRRQRRQGRHMRPRRLQIVWVAHPHRPGHFLNVPRSSAMRAGLACSYAPTRQDR